MRVATQPRVATAPSAAMEAMRSVAQKQLQHEWVSAMKYEPTVLTGSAPVTNFSASSLTTTGTGRP